MVLRHMLEDEKTYQEIADHFGVSRSAIAGLLYRLRLKYSKYGCPVPSAEPSRSSYKERLLASAPQPLNLTILQLTSQTCPFPVGESIGEQQVYCGHPKGATDHYCAIHKRIAYRSGNRKGYLNDSFAGIVSKFWNYETTTEAVA